MKKLVLTLAIIGFITFGALSIQKIIASTSQVEMVNFDKDPKKNTDKKTTEAKSVNTEAKATSSDKKDCSSSCSDKSASSKACCGEEKSGCCSSGPDKK